MLPVYMCLGNTEPSQYVGVIAVVRWRILILALVACGPESAAEAPRAEEEPAETHAWRSPPISWRRVQIESLSSPSVQARRVELLIPSTPSPADGFPFLVVTDGDLAFDDAWFGVDSALSTLVNEGTLDPWVLIAIPAIDRMPEMTPTLASRRALRTGRRLEQPHRGVEAFADYIVDVVLPAVQEEVSLSEHGAVLGYSFGGLAALHIGLRYPEHFPRVIAMSPSLWFSERAALQAVAHASVWPRRVWLDVGTREGNGRQDVPYMVADARQLRIELERHQVSVGYYEAIGRPHGSNEAGPRMGDALRYALSDEDCVPTRLDLHVFRQESVVGRSVPTTVLGHCADGSPRTISPRDVRLEAQGATTSVDGLIRATQPGEVPLRVAYEGLEATAAIRFTRR
ncbi:MAG: enterochelin esterase-like enzyme [Polyangiales bacterium]|jgi:enterochelin esterase-like enzyme